MSIFRRKKVNESKMESNKEQVNEKESKNQVVCPDFSKANFYDISPDQMEKKSNLNNQEKDRK